MALLSHSLNVAQFIIRDTGDTIRVSWYPGVKFSGEFENRLVPAGFLKSRTSGRYRPTPTLFRRWCVTSSLVENLRADALPRQARHRNRGPGSGAYALAMTIGQLISQLASYAGGS